MYDEVNSLSLSLWPLSKVEGLNMWQPPSSVKNCGHVTWEKKEVLPVVKAGFTLFHKLFYLIGPENSRHPLNQSDWKLKLIAMQVGRTRCLALHAVFLFLLWFFHSFLWYFPFLWSAVLITLVFVFQRSVEIALSMHTTKERIPTSPGVKHTAQSWWNLSPDPRKTCTLKFCLKIPGGSRAEEWLDEWINE